MYVFVINQDIFTSAVIYRTRVNVMDSNNKNRQYNWVHITVIRRELVLEYIPLNMIYIMHNLSTYRLY